jgi:hypothetical protein
MATEFKIEDFLTKHGTKEANECLSSRLESLRAFFDNDEWKKGVSIHIQALIGDMMQTWLLKRTNVSEEFARGYCSALIRVLALPTTVENQINTEAANKKTGASIGTAGY